MSESVSMNESREAEASSGDPSELRFLRQTQSMIDLPESAHDVIEIIGLERTIDLVRAFGGTEIKVAAVVNGDSHAWAALELAIGFTAAKQLVESRFKGTSMYVPRCDAALRAKRRREMAAVRRRGVPVDDIARHFGVTRSYVYRIVKSEANR